MSESEKREESALEPEELERVEGELLTDREAMMAIRPPIDPGPALEIPVLPETNEA